MTVSSPTNLPTCPGDIIHQIISRAMKCREGGGGGGGAEDENKKKQQELSNHFQVAFLISLEVNKVAYGGTYPAEFKSLI